MGKLLVSNIVSVDGRYADESGNPLVLNMDAAFNDYNLERISAAGTVLLGRDSFDGFSGYWPFIADAPEAPDDPRFASGQREMSRIYNGLPKVVVTDRAAPGPDNAWYDTTTVVPRANAAAWVNRAKDEVDGDILMFASRRLWNSLLRAGVVDEIHLLISPNAVGAEGVPVFEEPTSLDLLEVRRFDASGNVLLRYAAV